jgi:undecaprenyl-diphosphatase
VKLPSWLSLASLREVGPIAVLGIIALGFLGFAELADEVFEQETHGFDTAVLTFLRMPEDTSTPIGPSWLLNALTDITALGGYAVLTLLTIAAALYRLLRNDRAGALVIAAAVASGAILGNLLKLGFDRPRPDIVEHLTHAASSSFPSGHATLAAVTYLTLGALIARGQPDRRLKALVLGGAILITILVGFSRIYLGVHWPTDVLAGWCLGAAWAALWWLVLLRLKPASEDVPSNGG